MLKILITGINGQDGSWLADTLVSTNNSIFGVIRNHSHPEHQTAHIRHLSEKVKIYNGDLIDPNSIRRILSEVQPDQIYHLAGHSYVGASFDQPSYSINVNTLGTLHLLEAIRCHCPKTRLFFASTSEIFGNEIDSDGLQRITTRTNPVSPYGISKLAAQQLCQNYRRGFGLDIRVGIFFSHESPRRSANFVIQKIISSAVRIAKGSQIKVETGSLDISRDWGHSHDYVRATQLIMNHRTPSDWVVATGVSYTLREICQKTFHNLGLNYEDYVAEASSFQRPLEILKQCGDSTPLKEELGWQPAYNIEKTIDELTKYWFDKL